MRIAHALQMAACRQGGLEVLLRALITMAPDDDGIFLASQEQRPELAAFKWTERIADHFEVPTDKLTREWSRDLIRWLRESRIDVCHFHLSGTYGWNSRSWNCCPITMVAEAGIPCVVTNHSGNDIFAFVGAHRPLWQKILAFCVCWPAKARQLHAIKYSVSVSVHDWKVARRWFPFFRRKLLQIYHSRLGDETPARGCQSEHVILNVGTIGFHKGQNILVEAFAKIASGFPEWSLRLVGHECGDGCGAALRDVIGRYDLDNRIRLCGPEVDPTASYQQCSVYVQPSRIEGLGLSLQEAMFHGRASIGSDVGGIPELIQHGANGLLFPVGDTERLALALSEVMTDQDKRRRLGLAARKSIIDREMTARAMVAKYRTIYQNALSTK